MPLIAAAEDMEVRIAKIAAEGELKKHLSDMGIIPGEKITVISSRSGSVIVRVKEGRVALDRNLATRIFVA